MEKDSLNTKHGYRQPPNGSLIEGIDLLIDQNTQKLCETYNQSSGATRSILYLLLVVTAISVIAVFNSNWAFNWDHERIQLYSDSVVIYKIQLNKFRDSLKKMKCNKKGYVSDVVAQKNFKVTTTLLVNLSNVQAKLNGFINANIENNDAVKVSIIGVTIDINDLVSICGITLIILLIVLRFTITREKHNLKIAFNSINERYNSRADYLKLREIYINDELSFAISKELTKDISNKERIILLNSKNGAEWDDLISDINFTRRRYHYNFLSMNEVFNLPLLDTNINENKDPWIERHIKKFINVYLFYFFLFVYSYAVLNDFCSLKKARTESHYHTDIIVFISLFCFFMIFNLCRDSVEHKKIVNNLFYNFWTKNYTYDYQDYSIKKLPFYKSIGYPAIMIVGIYLLSLIIHFISGLF